MGGGKDSIGQRERFSLFRFSGTRGGLGCEAEFETEGAGTFLQMKMAHRLTSIPRTTAVPCWRCWATGTKLPSSALLLRVFRGPFLLQSAGWPALDHTPSRPRRPINPHRSPPYSKFTHLSSSLPAAIIPAAVALLFAALPSCRLLLPLASSAVPLSRLRKLPQPDATRPSHPISLCRPPRCCCCSVSCPSPYSVSRPISPLDDVQGRTIARHDHRVRPSVPHR